MMRLLEKPDRHAVIALSAIAPAERPAFFLTLMTRLWDLRKRYGRPHWIVVNDAHLLMPAMRDASDRTSRSRCRRRRRGLGRRGRELPRLRGSVIVASDPRQLAAAAIESVSTLVAAGPSAPEALRAFCEARGLPAPALTLPEGARGRAIADGRGGCARFRSRDWIAIARFSGGPPAAIAPRIFRIGRCRESRR